MITWETSSELKSEDVGLKLREVPCTGVCVRERKRGTEKERESAHVSQHPHEPAPT